MRGNWLRKPVAICYRRESNIPDAVGYRLPDEFAHAKP